MRRIISLVIAATMLLSSCEHSDLDTENEVVNSDSTTDSDSDSDPDPDSDPDSDSTTVTIPLQYTSVKIEAESTEQEVAFTATESWEISLEETKATPTWITVSPMSGDAGYIKLSITLEPNTETEDRSTVITITSGGEESEIVVTQEAAEELDDRAILMELYEATDGDNWTNNKNWCSDEPIYYWYGVYADFDNNVFQLNLEDNSLSGTLPESIGNLESLEYLTLRNNYSLTGEIPESIKNLKQLKSLYIDYTALSGTIPECIGDLTNLTYLNIGFSQLTGSIPSSIGNLRNLTGLVLNNNTLSGSIPESSGNLNSLSSFFKYLITSKSASNTKVSFQGPSLYLPSSPTGFKLGRLYLLATLLSSSPNPGAR